MEYKTLGDTLSTAEFNGFVCLLRHNATLREEFTINNNIIHGLYGDYSFDLTDAIILDNGVFLSNETKANPYSITLSNPIFSNSNYILTLKLMSIEDYNICIEEATDFTRYETMEIPLSIGSNPLSFEDYDDGVIVLFDVILNINHNKSIITIIEE